MTFDIVQVVQAEAVRKLPIILKTALSDISTQLKCGLRRLLEVVVCGVLKGVGTDDCIRLSKMVSTCRSTPGTLAQTPAQTLVRIPPQTRTSHVDRVFRPYLITWVALFGVVPRHLKLNISRASSQLRYLQANDLQCIDTFMAPVSSRKMIRSK